MADKGFLTKEKLTAICDSIRAKTGSTGLIPIDDIPQAITNIQTGGGIIEVDELPTENINGDTVYKLNLYDMYIQSTLMGSGFHFSDMIKKIYIVESLPTENINETTDEMYLYFSKADNIGVTNGSRL